MNKKQFGFNLIELAVVLVIIGLLSSGGLALMKTQQQAAKQADSKSKVVNIKNMLLMFVSVNGYLPCPDSNADGEENRNTTTFVCSASKGAVPYLELGLSELDVLDAYGNRIVYAVNRNTTNTANICDEPGNDHAANYFCSDNAPGFDLATPPTVADASVGNYTICNDDYTGTGGCSGSTILQQDVSIVIVAHHSNGPSCSGAGNLEEENCDADAFYAKGSRSMVAATFYDDEVETISANEIKAAYLKSHPTDLRP